MSISYGKVEKIDVEGYVRKIFHVSDLTLNSDLESNSNNVEGNSFLYFINDFQYTHALQDAVGHYEFLRQHIPDLQLIILSQNGIDPKTGKVKTINAVVDNIIEKYPEFIFVNDKEKTLIKNVYYLFNTFMRPLCDVVDTGDLIFTKEDPDFHYQVAAARVIVERFGPKNPVKPTKKIYISRSIADTTYEAKYLHDYKRIRVLENSKLLENYLESIGYEIILNEGLSVEEQASIYQSASHVITINGTGAYNTIFCDPGTTIFLLDVHTEYDWFYDVLISQVTSNFVHKLPSIKTSGHLEGHPIVVEQLIRCLKGYEDILWKYQE